MRYWPDKDAETDGMRRPRSRQRIRGAPVCFLSAIQARVFLALTRRVDNGRNGVFYNGSDAFTRAGPSVCVSTCRGGRPTTSTGKKNAGCGIPRRCRSTGWRTETARTTLVVMDGMLDAGRRSLSSAVPPLQLNIDASADALHPRTESPAFSTHETFRSLL